MNPLFIHKQHICLECTTTLNDTEDLHPFYNRIIQMPSLNVQGYKSTSGASACTEVSWRFLHGFRMLDRCLFEKPQDNLLWKNTEARGITLWARTIYTVWRSLGFLKKKPTTVEIIAANKYDVIFLILFSNSQRHVAVRNQRLLSLAQYEDEYSWNLWICVCSQLFLEGLGVG